MNTYKSTRLSHIGQTKRSKEYSPSKNVIYSSLAVEEDQKQIIVSKLRQEISLLQKNQSEFVALKEHYRKLDHQFNILFNEKKSNDQSFAKHHQAALKQICLMKNQIDSTKIQFRQNKLEIQDLQADQNTLKNQLDQKQIEIQKLKNELRSSIADNDELASEQFKLGEIHKNVSEQRQKRAQDCQKMKMDVDRVSSKIQELTNYQFNLQKQQKVLTEQIIRFQQENNRTDEDISATCEDLAILDQKTNDSQQYITDLQRKIAETTTSSDKYKNQALFNKKSIQAEVMKNNDITKNIQQAQHLFNVRQNQVKQGHRQLQVLTEENISLEKVNSQLQDDFQACRRHLDNMALLNGQLVQHMQVISEQDQHARALIDRKDRVQRAEQIVRQVDLSRKDLNMMATKQSSVNSSPYRSKTVRKYY